MQKSPRRSLRPRKSRVRSGPAAQVGRIRRRGASRRGPTLSGLGIAARRGRGRSRGARRERMRGRKSPQEDPHRLRTAAPRHPQRQAAVMRPFACFGTKAIRAADLRSLRRTSPSPGPSLNRESPARADPGAGRRSAAAWKTSAAPSPATTGPPPAPAPQSSRLGRTPRPGFQEAAPQEGGGRPTACRPRARRRARKSGNLSFHMRRIPTSCCLSQAGR